MKALIVNLLRSFLLKIVGKERLEKIVLKFTDILGINLLFLAYHKMGILKYWNDDVSGENFLVSEILGKYLPDSSIVVFDVGANVGNYTHKLNNYFPNASIYAFEPNPNAFCNLKERFTESNVECFNLGLSSNQSIRKIYTYSHQNDSEHASLYKNVLVELHHAESVLEMEFSTTTVDIFCQERKIDHIHFVKIDTEGHELDVLIGAKKMIAENRIDIIQFEFNEMNVISKVFLKDFYDLLDYYRIYRLDSNRLIPLFEYNSMNEIFKFQNLLAVHKSLEECI